MEQWVRVQNEHDRQVLAWLRERVGDAAVTAAAQACARGDTKPYLSTVCRQLGLSVPPFTRHGASADGIGERTTWRQCMRFCVRRWRVPTPVDDLKLILVRFEGCPERFGTLGQA